MAKKNSIGYYYFFIKNLDQLGGREHIGVIYRQLFRLLPVSQVEDELKYMHTVSIGKDKSWKAEGKRIWFAAWHKSVRQCDYFNDCFQNKTLPLLTEEESAELKFLRHKFRIKKASSIAGKKKGELFNAEYNHYLELAEKKRREVRQEPINGVLDSILWNMVHMDNKDFLYNLFKKTFKDFENQ